MKKNRLPIVLLKVLPNALPNALLLSSYSATTKGLYVREAKLIGELLLDAKFNLIIAPGSNLQCIAGDAFKNKRGEYKEGISPACIGYYIINKSSKRIFNGPEPNFKPDLYEDVGDLWTQDVKHLWKKRDGVAIKRADIAIVIGGERFVANRMFKAARSIPTFYLVGSSQYIDNLVFEDKSDNRLVQKINLIFDDISRIVNTKDDCIFTAYTS